jgi:hypothetical protein
VDDLVFFSRAPRAYAPLMAAVLRGVLVLTPIVLDTFLFVRRIAPANTVLLTGTIEVITPRRPVMNPYETFGFAEERHGFPQ